MVCSTNREREQGARTIPARSSPEKTAVFLQKHFPFLEQVFFEPYKQAGGKLLEGTLRLILWAPPHKDAVRNARALNESLGDSLSREQMMLAERLFMHTPFMGPKMISNEGLRIEFLRELDCLMQASRFNSKK